jgi:hypothetical protein
MNDSQSTFYEILCNVLSVVLLAENQITFGKFRMQSLEGRHLNLMKSRIDLRKHVPQYHLASNLRMKPPSLNRI